MVSYLKIKVKELQFAPPSAIIHFTIIPYNNAFHIQKGKHMTYQQFAERISNELTLFLKGETIAEVHTSLKNNGVTRLGVSISDPSINISPTIYLEDFYNQYQNGVHFLDIIKKIMDIYEEVRFEHSWELGDLLHFESIKPKLAYKLIHKKENMQLLQDIPSLSFHDFAIVFYLIMEISSSGSGTILITNGMLRSWDVDIRDLYEAASANTPSILPADFRPMQAVIREMLGSDSFSDIQDDNHMYILTNSIRHFGATAILYRGMLEQIGEELHDDYYILPSSIHEVIILPRRYSPSPEDLDAMIVEINETQVQPDEILSDHAYYYSRLHKSLFLTR